MSLKLVLISVDGTIVGPDGKINVHIVEDLAKLAGDLAKRGVQVAFWSNKTWIVNKSFPLADFFSKMTGFRVELHGKKADGSPARRIGESAAPILTRYGAKKAETVLVGGMHEDMLAGVNNQLLLIRPNWYGQQIDYGFPVNNVSELARFFLLFALREHPIFWQLTTGNLSMSSAGPFSTMRKDYAEFGSDARSTAKFGMGKKEFWFYLTVSSLYFSGLVHEIDMICSYPGHDPAKTGGIKDEINETLTRFGKCFKKPYYHDLIIRHTAAPKSQKTSAVQRRFLPQLNTIHLNAHPHANLSPAARKSAVPLKHKRVLVVDDFCTSGKSFESARAYIEAAGGIARHFSWLKTINSDYTEMRPLPTLLPFQPNELATEPTSVRHSYHVGIVNLAAATELRKIFREYIGWK